jgi:hypothetical protein
MEALHLVIDDAAPKLDAQRAARLLGLSPAAATLWYVFAAFFALAGVAMLGSQSQMTLFGHRFAYGWLLLGQACTQVIQARRFFGGSTSLVMPMDFTVSDDGLAYTLRATSASIAVPWKRIRSVRNHDDGFIVLFRERFTDRMLLVPKPSDVSLAQTIWTAFYTHLVAQRGLRASSPNRLGVITNTVYANG